MYKLYFDGASRSNPGPASYGGIIIDPKGNSYYEYNQYIGKQTNNVAEYLGLFEGLRLCQAFEIKNVEIYGDSKLVINQVKRVWKVKSSNLIPIHHAITELLEEYKFENISFNHVLRKFNKKADELANRALDNYLKNKS
jgi:ribonuclease HI